MKILFTGASSFTGFWFVRALARAGAEVTAALRGRPELYAGVRAERVAALGVETIPDCAFGAAPFLQLMDARAFDVLCCHAAEVRDYRSADFDALAAVAANTHNIRATLARFAGRGGRVVVATGSVFEPDEGVGPEPRRAFSPYGLSKALTWSVLRFESERAGLAAHKFVVANPFGPYEEPRFVAHAVARWRQGDILEVRTPRYLRDNIHVELLARTYAGYVAETARGGAPRVFGPCGYLETQGAFAQRLARELGPRLGLDARVAMAEQADFSEPLARVNRDAIDPAAYRFDEGAAWDALAQFYREARSSASP